MHEGGFGLTVTDVGVFVFTRPDGRRVAENGSERFRGNIFPQRVVAARDFSFEETLRVYRLNREAGVTVTDQTSRCQWLGEGMDYSTAIEAMQFLEQKAALESLHG